MASLAKVALALHSLTSLGGTGAGAWVVLVLVPGWCWYWCLGGTCLAASTSSCFPRQLLFKNDLYLQLRCKAARLQRKSVCGLIFTLVCKYLIEAPESSKFYPLAT